MTASIECERAVACASGRQASGASALPRIPASQGHGPMVHSVGAESTWRRACLCRHPSMPTYHRQRACDRAVRKVSEGGGAGRHPSRERQTPARRDRVFTRRVRRLKGTARKSLPAGKAQMNGEIAGHTARCPSLGGRWPLVFEASWHGARPGAGSPSRPGEP
jgi:hypothetical protein